MCSDVSKVLSAYADLAAYRERSHTAGKLSKEALSLFF